MNISGPRLRRAPQTYEWSEGIPDPARFQLSFFSYSKVRMALGSLWYNSRYCLAQFYIWYLSYPRIFYITTFLTADIMNLWLNYHCLNNFSAEGECDKSIERQKQIHQNFKIEIANLISDIDRELTEHFQLRHWFSNLS